MSQSCHWECTSNSRPSWSCTELSPWLQKRGGHCCLRLLTLPSLAQIPWWVSSSLYHLVLPGLLWDGSSKPNSIRPLQSYFISLYPPVQQNPVAGKGPPQTQAETEARLTHQLFEEGGFLVLLRVALVLVQAILQLQCECVIVGSHYL